MGDNDDHLILGAVVAFSFGIAGAVLWWIWSNLANATSNFTAATQLSGYALIAGAIGLAGIIIGALFVTLLIADP